MLIGSGWPATTRHCDGCSIGDVRIWNGLAPPPLPNWACHFSGIAIATWDFADNQVEDWWSEPTLFNRFPLTAGSGVTTGSWGTPNCVYATNGQWTVERGQLDRTTYPTNFELLASAGGTSP